MRTSHTLTLALICATTIAAAPMAQRLVPSPLPPDQTRTVFHHLKSGRLESVVRSTLNSPGDSITVDVFAEASGALIAVLNAGGRVGFEVDITKTKAGYEVSMGANQSVTMGVEAFEGLEANARVGSNQKVVFQFASFRQLGSDLRMMALASVLKLQKSLPVVQKAMNAAQRTYNAARTVWNGAIRTLNLGRATEKTLNTAYRAAGIALNTATRVVSGAQSKVNAALATVRRWESKVRGFMGFVFKPALAAARVVLNVMNNALRAAHGSLNAKRVAHARSRSAWLAQTRRVSSAIRDEMNKRKLKDRAFANLQQYRNVYGQMTGPMSRLATLLHAAEFEVFGGGEISAALSIPGVSMNNLGVGIRGNAKLAGRIRTEFPTPKKPTRLIVGLSSAIAGEISGGLGLGAAGSASNEFSLNVTFVKPRNQRFRKESLTTAMELDIAVEGRVGAGVSIVRGAGQTFRIQMNEAQWKKAIGRVGNLFSNPSLTNLRRALTGIQVTFSSQSRRISGARAEFGFSLLGWGVGIGGNAIWADRGTHNSYDTNALEMITVFTTPSFWKQTARSLNAMR